MAGDSKPTRALDGVEDFSFRAGAVGTLRNLFACRYGRGGHQSRTAGRRRRDPLLGFGREGIVFRLRLAQPQQAQPDRRRERRAGARDSSQAWHSRSDIFFENYAPGVAGRLGLGYEKLSELNPRLIYCSLSGYGQDGPYRDVKAYDLTDSRRRRHHRHHWLSRQTCTRGHCDRRHRLRHVCGHRNSSCALPARKTGEGQLDRRFDARLDRLLAGLFSASLLACRRRAGARWACATTMFALWSVSGRRRRVCKSRGGERVGLGSVLQRVIEKPELLDPTSASPRVEGRRKNRGVLGRNHREYFCLNAITSIGSISSRKPSCRTASCAASRKCSAHPQVVGTQAHSRG